MERLFIPADVLEYISESNLKETIYFKLFYFKNQFRNHTEVIGR